MDDVSHLEAINPKYPGFLRKFDNGWKNPDVKSKNAKAALEAITTMHE